MSRLLSKAFVCPWHCDANGQLALVRVGSKGSSDIRTFIPVESLAFCSLISAVEANGKGKADYICIQKLGY